MADKELNLKRTQKPEPEVLPETPSVSAGAIDRVIDLAFNPSRDKIREVTIIDRMQGRLLPLLDLIDMMWNYTIEIATFRQNKENYKLIYKKEQPEPPNMINEYTYRLAQWQKSVQGHNLDKAIDIGLAETEKSDDSIYDDEQTDYK